MSGPVPLAALISGGGRTVLNLADRIDDGELEAEIVTVVAHREDLAGVKRCRDRGLSVTVLERGPAETLDDRLDATLLESGARCICLCGYLRHFRIGTLWAGRTVNIHPALLPDFGGRGMYGDRVHRAVIDSGVRTSGCTVHYVDEEYDHGPTILQRSCEVLPDDDADALAARVFELECRAFPEALRAILGDDPIFRRPVTGPGEPR